MSKFFYLRGVRRCLRIGLWVGVCVLIFFLWQYIHSLPGYSWKRISYVLDDPEFHSLSKKGHTYVLRGDSAFQEAAHRYGFVNPWAKLETSSQESPFVIQGERGRYDQNKNFLEVYGKVRLASQGNYTLWTPYAFMDLKKKEVSGDRPVKGSGPLGDFKAQGFWLNQKEIHLKGPAVMNIEDL